MRWCEEVAPSFHLSECSWFPDQRWSSCWCPMTHTALPQHLAHLGPLFSPLTIDPRDLFYIKKGFCSVDGLPQGIAFFSFSRLALLISRKSLLARERTRISQGRLVSGCHVDWEEYRGQETRRVWKPTWKMRNQGRLGITVLMLKRWFRLYTS